MAAGVKLVATGSILVAAGGIRGYLGGCWR